MPPPEAPEAPVPPRLPLLQVRATEVSGAALETALLIMVKDCTVVIPVRNVVRERLALVVLVFLPPGLRG